MLIAAHEDDEVFIGSPKLESRGDTNAVTSQG